MTDEENKTLETVNEKTEDSECKNYLWEDGITFNTLDLNKGIVTIHKHDSISAIEPLIWSLFFYDENPELHNGLAFF